jgi:SUF system NifU family Fe-S assembly protein
MSATASADITSLYQEVIIDHARRPRNFRQLEGASQRVEAVNPLCGDQLTLYIQLADGAIADIAFEGNGCAISQASASLMTMAMKGLRQEAALALFTRVHTMLTTEFEAMRRRPRSASWRFSRVCGSTRCGSNAPPWPGRRCAAPLKTPVAGTGRSRQP